MHLLVTGGAGFIGSNFILDWLSNKGGIIVNYDKLTYAGNPNNLNNIARKDNYYFIKGDICNFGIILNLLKEYEIDAIINFAAESHVDRSIHGPDDFIKTNIVGTFRLLEASRAYYASLDGNKKDIFRFLHVSTDEVYGSLNIDEPPFREDHRYEPNSPYSASKASSDHLVRAYNQTYNLPILITNCSNNYGPFQFPEKLIPLCIHNGIANKSLPIYGDGQQIRDWIYVKDHCDAICKILKDGRIGETYNIGGGNELKNLEVVKIICNVLDQEKPRNDGISYNEQIVFVKDRPGHDRRYAINANKIEREIGWKPVEKFETGIRKTVRWYLDNPDWVSNVTSGTYRDWIKMNYAQ